MPTPAVAAPALLEALPDVVVVADVRGRIVYANPAVGSLLGHEPPSCGDEPLTVLIPERLRPRTRAGSHRFLPTGPAPGRRDDPGPGAARRRVRGRRRAHPVAPRRRARRRPVGRRTRRRRGRRRGGRRRPPRREHAVRLERQLEVGRYLDAHPPRDRRAHRGADADVAFQQLLPTLCAELDWDAATLWQPDGCGGRLGHAGTWTPPGSTRARAARPTSAGAHLRPRRGAARPRLAVARHRSSWRTSGPTREFLRARRRPRRRPAHRRSPSRCCAATPCWACASCSPASARPVPPELLDVLASAGRQIGQFLARLRAESELRELADTLQRSLLPSHLPDIPGSQLAARYRAGAEGVFVGGDTYDVAAAARRPLDGAHRRRLRHRGGGRRHDRGDPAHRPGGRVHRRSPADVLAAVNTALLHEQTGGPAAVRHRVLPGAGAARHRGATPGRRGRASAAAAPRRRRRGRPRSVPPGRRSASRRASATGSCGSSCPPARRWCSTPTASPRRATTPASSSATRGCAPSSRATTAG